LTFEEIKKLNQTLNQTFQIFEPTIDKQQLLTQLEELEQQKNQHPQPENPSTKSPTLEETSQWYEKNYAIEELYPKNAALNPCIQHLQEIKKDDLSEVKFFDAVPLTIVKAGVKAYLAELQTHTTALNGPYGITNRLLSNFSDNIKAVIDADTLDVDLVKIVWLASKWHNNNKNTNMSSSVLKMSFKCKHCNHIFTLFEEVCPKCHCEFNLLFEGGVL
jgi:hypothetical protein